MATDIEIVQTALVEFDKVRAGLAQLETTYKGVLFDVETPKGMELAKAARQVLRAPRYAVEKIRKETKAPLLALGRKLDADAAAITAEIMKLEDPIDQQIKNEEDRKERERQAKIDAENARIAGINSAIDAIRALPVRASGKTSAQIAMVQAEAAAIVIDASFAEFAEQANAALAQTVAALAGLHAGAVAAEAEAARLAAEREELARLRAAEEQRAQAERARIAEEERVARVAREAEQARQQEELRRQREQLERDTAEQNRLAQVERERVAAEDRKREEAAERNAAALEEIMGIQHQVMIASVGRAGVRAGGTLECAEETLAETEGWELTPERFGALYGSAVAAKESALTQIRALVDRLRKEEIQREQKRLAEAERAPAKSARPSDEQIAAVIAEYFGVDAKVACQWLAEFGTAQAA